jgi:hypothetical protein
VRHEKRLRCRVRHLAFSSVASTRRARYGRRFSRRSLGRSAKHAKEQSHQTEPIGSIHNVQGGCT